MTHISAVILASGYSRRLGFNKLLVRIDKKTVIERSLEPFLNPLIDKIFVVVGYEKEKIIKAVNEYTVEIIENPYYHEGMSASIKASLAYLNDYEGVFFQLGDRPFVDNLTIEKMYDAFKRGYGDIVVPIHERKKGHPVLIKHKSYLEEISNIKGDVGLREIIDKYIKNVVFIESHEGVLIGVDTINDIENLKMRGYEIEKD